MKKIIYLLFTFQLLSLTVYSQPVTQEWVRRYSGFGYADGLSVKLDSIGNVYVLIKLYTDTTFNDYGLLKYNSSGNLLWSKYYNSPGNLSENPVAFIVSARGDSYITGNQTNQFNSHINTH